MRQERDSVVQTASVGNAERVLPIVGVTTVALVAAALFVLGDAEAAGRGRVLVHTYLFTAAMVSFIIFAAVVTAALDAGRSDWLRRAAFGSAVMFAVLQAAAVMPRAALSYRLANQQDAGEVRLFLDLGRVTNFSSDLALAGFLVLVGLATVRSARVLSAWVAFTGALCAVVAAGTGPGVFGLVTEVLSLVWILMVSIPVNLRRTGR
jgi:hypothetical protein